MSTLPGLAVADTSVAQSQRGAGIKSATVPAGDVSDPERTIPRSTNNLTLDEVDALTAKHAWGSVGPFLAGQTRRAFMPGPCL
jgi:hypothetical protein